MPSAIAQRAFQFFRKGDIDATLSVLEELRGSEKEIAREMDTTEDINVPLDIPPVEDIEFDTAQEELFSPPTSPTLRRSTRQRKQTTFFQFDKEHGYKEVSNYLRLMSKKLSRCAGNSYRENYIANLVLDPNFGLINYLGATTFIKNPYLFKIRATRDPDTPNIGEAMSSPYRHEFLVAMKKEIEELEAHDTWEIVKKDSIQPIDGIMPNIIQSTWVFKIKRYPDGHLRKFKARFCVRGDAQVEGLDYFESYAPVASWNTIRIILIMSLQQGWKIKQADFSNAMQSDMIKDALDYEIIYQKVSKIMNQSYSLIEYISKYFTLKIGDIIFTGTPVGVGRVAPQDVLTGYLADLESF